MNAYMNKNNGKLIAAIAVFAMIACCLAVAVPADAVDDGQMAVETPTGEEGTDYVVVSDDTELSKALNETIKNIVISPAEGKNVEIPGTFNIPADYKVYIGKNAAVNGEWDAEKGTNVTNDKSVKVTFENLTVKGTLYNNLGFNKNTSALIINGTLTVSGTGAVYSTSAIGGDLENRNGFFTSSVRGTGSVPTVYTHLYSAQISAIAKYVNDTAYTNPDLGTDSVIIAYGNTTISKDDATKAASDIADVLLYANKNSSLTIPADTDVTFESVEISEKGQINLYGKLKATTSAENNGTVRMMSADASFTAGAEGKTPITGNGSLDTSAISSEANLGGILQTSTEFGPNQIVTVDRDLTLVKGTELTIQGKIIIPEGVTVTIEDGGNFTLTGQAAVLENNRTIIVEALNGFNVAAGAEATNNGTITSDFIPGEGQQAGTTITVAGTLENKGSVSIGSDSGIKITGALVNGVDGTIALNGKASGTTIENAGSITVDATISGNMTISMSAANATVSVVSATGGILSINDAAFDDKKAVYNYNKTSQIDFNAGADEILGGIVVKSVTYTSDDDANNDGKKDVIKALDVSGTLNWSYVGDNKPTTHDAAVRLHGYEVIISETLNIGEDGIIKFGPTDDSETTITISGTVNITNDKSSVVFDGTSTDINVTGIIVSQVDLSKVTNYGNVMNAAAYDITTETADKVYYYTTLKTAASATGVTSIVVNGNIEVDGQVNIASGVTVKQNANSKITINEDGRIDVANGGKITSGNIEVDGILYVENARSGFSNGTAVSEVYSSNGTDAMYTNLVDAMAAAESGDVIELYS